jgi:hypothetical protein
MIGVPPEVLQRIRSAKNSQFEPNWSVISRLLEEHDKRTASRRREAEVCP